MGCNSVGCHFGLPGIFLPVFLLHFGGHTVQLAVILPQRCLGKARVEPVNADISLSVFMAHRYVFHTRAIFDRVAHVLQFENKPSKLSVAAMACSTSLRTIPRMVGLPV